MRLERAAWEPRAWLAAQSNDELARELHSYDHIVRTRSGLGIADDVVSGVID